MKKNVKNLSVFVCICVVITLLVALTNHLTAPIIANNRNASENAALIEVMRDGTDFETVSTTSYTLPSTVTEVYRETSGLGYVMKLVTSGYKSDMVIMCGIGADGTVTGAVCISSNETLGKEKSYGENFVGKDAVGVGEVDTVGGATKTTAAYKNAINDALSAKIILDGGSVDLRSEEEILNDTLTAALPVGEGKFERLFLTELIEDIDAVYAAENGTGYVFVVGGSFIGALSDGTVVTDGVENAAAITDAVAALVSSQIDEIDISAYPDLAKTVISAAKTASGNYVVETKGAGYGIKGGSEYHPSSGEYIIVRVSMTADGRIIDCITVSEGETDGIGDACADESFYGQFVGKTEENYTDIDAISGATLTTNGYKQAIERAFAAIEILKGGK